MGKFWAALILSQFKVATTLLVDKFLQFLILCQFKVEWDTWATIQGIVAQVEAMIMILCLQRKIILRQCVAASELLKWSTEIMT